MAPITIAAGVVLVVLGLVGYLPDQASVTALLPAAFGVLLLVFGVAALFTKSDRARMHVMHAAVLVGLLGFLASAGRLGAVLAAGTIEANKGFWMLALTALTCAAFVGLCVKSFIDARRRRRQQTAA